MRNVFRNLENDVVKLVKINGDVIDDIPAHVQPKMIFISDANLPIEEGDKLVRVLPNGLIESYEVLDRGYHGAIRGIAAHYQVKVRKETSIESKKTESIINIYNMGDNSRINNSSEDNSTNIVINTDNKIFGQIRDAFDKLDDDEEKEKMKKLVDEIHNEYANKSPTRGEKYKEFIALTAAHIGIIAPFIPELTKLFL